MAKPEVVDNGELLEDIGTHFSNQLRNLVIDTAGTCRLAGIHPSDFAKMLMGVLLGEVMYVADILRFDRRMFLRFCRDTYQIWRGLDGEENQTLGGGSPSV